MLFFREIRHFLFQFSSIKIDDYLLDFWFYRQPNLAMFLLGFEDSSNLKNLCNWFWITASVLTIHLITYFLKETFTKYNQKGFICKPFRKFGSWMTFGIYIRYFQFSIVLVLLACVSEISHFKTHTKTYSLIWAFVFVSVLSILVLISVVDYMIRLIYPKVNDNSMLKELYNGIRK